MMYTVVSSEGLSDRICSIFMCDLSDMRVEYLVMGFELDDQWMAYSYSDI